MAEEAGRQVESEDGGVSARQPRNLSEWADVISRQGMPTYAQTIQSISGVASDRESSASELSNVILQDAAMTAKLLKVANSPMYNVQGRSVSTVSRAVVLLGFNTVRSLCLSLAVVESAARGTHRERLAQDMARSFHAAVQARTFAEKRKDRSPEEVFIATLLFNLGRLAFWSHKSELADALNEQLAQPGVEPEKLEHRLLGFTLQDLTLQLTREWRLGALLEHSLEGQADADPRVSNVELARELAQTAERGWDTPEMKKLLARIAETLYLPLQDVVQLVHDNASEAQKTAAFFGAGAASGLIPLPNQQTARVRKEAPEVDGDINRFPEPDSALQLKILREVTALIEGRFDFNLMLEMVLEGIYRGVGMDRTLFALKTRDQQHLKARYVLGWDQQSLRERFVFELSDVKANIFLHVMDACQPAWINADSDPRLHSLVTDEVLQVTRNAPFLAMPIQIGSKAIGLFYADRLPSRRPIGEEDFSSFKHFGQQANMALSMLGRGGR